MTIAQHILLAAVWGYRAIGSPAKHALFGPLGRCRYTPTCSQFAHEAIERHGAAGGVFLAAGRLCRCHPWGGCGHDPVPPRPMQFSFFKFPSRPAADGNSPVRPPSADGLKLPSIAH